MQQHSTERAFIPVAVENGRARTWQKIRLCFSSFTNMASAEKKRLFVFAEEGQGYARSYARAHNRARFKSHARLLPQREQQTQRADTEKNRERRRAVIALRYGRRYNSTTQHTVERAEKAGIRIRLNSLILPYAEYRRLFNADMARAMNEAAADDKKHTE